MLFRLLISILMLMSTTAPPASLESDHIFVGFHPTASGAVSQLTLRKAISLPLLPDKGAGQAASGVLFAPTIEVNGELLAIPNAPIRAGATGEMVMESLLPGIIFTRTFRVNGSLLTIHDVVRNSSSTRQVVRFGGTSIEKRETWHLAQRSWIGAPSNRTALAENNATYKGDGRASWRSIKQYGVGFVATTEMDGEIEAREIPVEGPEVSRFEWSGRQVPLEGAKTLSALTTVFVLEGGSGRRESVQKGLLVETDLADAGRVGQPVRGFARTVSATARTVDVAVYSSESTDTPVLTQRIELQPGREHAIPFQVIPATKGALSVRTIAKDADSTLKVEAFAEAKIERSGAAWDLYTRRMPEEVFRGTWEQIGEQLAGSIVTIGAPTTPRIAKRAAANQDALMHYDRHFPYYASILRGAARILHADPELLAVSEPTADSVACMDIAILGPDGPINAYSKERGETDLKGLGYQKVLPAHGYSFHTYMSWGVNSAGLSTSAATLNEDAATKREGNRQKEAWLASGKAVIPAAIAKWLILAMASNVDEAIELIENSDVPFDLTANILLLDRAGNAARVSSAGLIRHIQRAKAPAREFFAVGNYPHARADGLFAIGDLWGWAANTMIREEALSRSFGNKVGRMSLDDVFTMMQSHGPGGMCQHKFDNPGLLYSSSSSIAVTQNSDLWLAHGPPCQVEYVRYRLDGQDRIQ